MDLNERTTMTASPDFIFNLSPGCVEYDIETYPNYFSVGLTHSDTGQYWYFEISTRRNDLAMLIMFIDTMRQQGCEMVGYNNVGFDYPVLHFIYENHRAGVSVREIYNKAMSIINAPHNARFAHMVWERDWIVPQIDLFKIHHFDNVARATSLKVLEFNMRMSSIEDLPFEPGTELREDQMDITKDYMKHDIVATGLFHKESVKQIEFRRQLTEKYDRNFMNHNDTKIGKDYFIMELERKNPGCCYTSVNGKKVMRQTVRESIALGDIIIDYIDFEQPEFKRILNWFKSQVITETKGSIKDVNCTINGFQYDFGTGGIHGATSPGIYESDSDFIVESRDVKSYYPNLAISNRFYPEHLGESFCDIYKDMYDQRQTYAKGTSENAMLKLALNGTYGDSNNKYSPFYDPQFTMSITVNGQLLLCMLVEQLLKVPSLEMLMINTDGLEYRVRREYVPHIDNVCVWWERLTGLELESDVYRKLCIRDCNNYIGVFE